MKITVMAACLSVLVGCGVDVEEEQVGSRSDALCATKNTCFGAAGPDCAPRLTPHFGCNGNNCSVSGGSIAHDTCCFANPNGVMCGGKSSSSACQAQWDRAIDREFYGLGWSRVVNTCTASTTGVVNMAEYCAPADTVVRPVDAAFCCGGSRPFNVGADMDIFRAQLANAAVIGQPLVVCTAPSTATPPTTPIRPGSVQDMACNPRFGCGANAACTQRTVRGVYGYYCMEY